jgi:hypothetical protein
LALKPEQISVVRAFDLDAEWEMANLQGDLESKVPEAKISGEITIQPAAISQERTPRNDALCADSGCQDRFKTSKEPKSAIGGLALKVKSLKKEAIA